MVHFNYVYLHFNYVYLHFNYVWCIQTTRSLHSDYTVFAFRLHGLVILYLLCGAFRLHGRKSL